MRWLQIILFMLALIVVQTTLLARLNFFGVTPDLVLVAVVIYAVLNPRPFSNVFAAGSGLIQDVLSTGVYINTLVKIILSNIVCNLKENFSGDEYQLILGLVMVSTPAVIVLEALFHLLVLKQSFSPYYFIFRLVAGTGYNLLSVPLLYPLLRRLSRGD